MIYRSFFSRNLNNGHYLAGSLHDFLKSNTVSWDILCKIADSIASGLAHLHEEHPPKNTLDVKLAVAHRDFKSKNVLIKNDLTACIGDFGLAKIFEPGGKVGETHAQQVRGSPVRLLIEPLQASFCSNIVKMDYTRIL